MSTEDAYDLGAAVANTWCVVAVRRNGSERVFGPWQTNADSPHAAAVVGVLRALSMPLAHPRRIHLRQTSAIKAVERDHAAALTTARASLHWSSYRAPDGEHEALVRAVMCLEMVQS